MFCTACGTKNVADSKFCKQCGHEIEKTSAGRIREEDFDRALPEDEQINALLERAYRARKAGDYAQAVALCQEALLLRPDSTTPHSLLGQIYESLGERDLAIRAYERVLQLNPGSIADRVKLDELRGGDLPVVRAATPPHIVFTQQRFGQGGNHLLVGVMAAVLVLVGAAIGLAWRGYAASPTTTKVAPSNTVQATGPAVNSLSASAGTQTPPASMGAADKQTVASQNPNNAVPAYNPFWGAPPTIIYTPPVEPARSNQLPAGINAERNQNLATGRLPGAKTNTKAGGRILLQSEDQTDDKGNVVIEVGPKDTQQAARATPANPGKISVTVGPKSGAVADTGNPPSYDARSYIAAGNDHEVNGEYDKAIVSYSRALPAAGDDLASVYQHIAHSYQLKGDKTSAITNYKNALAEYHKLVDAGKQVETAQEGINACEKAIKACNY